MSLPGEEAAYHTLYSSLSSTAAKAEAAVEIANIAEIRQRNAESDREWQARKRCNCETPCPIHGGN